MARLLDMARQMKLGEFMALLVVTTACTWGLASDEVTDQRQASWIGGAFDPPIGGGGQGSGTLCNSSGVFEKDCPTNCGPKYLKPKPIIPGQMLRHYAETGDQACTNTQACRDLELFNTAWNTNCDEVQDPG